MFLVSPDQEFGAKGAKSEIDYAHLFDEYKRLLMEYEATDQKKLKVIYQFFSDMAFDPKANTTKPAANSESSELESDLDSFEDLNLGDDADIAGSSNIRDADDTSDDDDGADDPNRPEPSLPAPTTITPSTTSLQSGGGAPSGIGFRLPSALTRVDLNPAPVTSVDSSDPSEGENVSAERPVIPQKKSKGKAAATRKGKEKVVNHGEEDVPRAAKTRSRANRS